MYVYIYIYDTYAYDTQLIIEDTVTPMWADEHEIPGDLIVVLQNEVFY